MLILTIRVSYHLWITYKAIEMEELGPLLFIISVTLLLHHISWFR